MKLLRLLLILACFLFALAIVSIWWNWPHQVDMATYAPADSLVYIELNSIADVSKAIRQSEVFKSILTLPGAGQSSDSKWALWAAKAGVAPAQSVIFTRAQMALVVIDIDRQTSEEALRVKPEAALIVETHTPKWRMKSVVVENLNQLARFAYGTATCQQRAANPDYIDCTEAAGSRKIVAAIDGSTVIVGNSEKATETCLAVRHGQRPNLATDPEFTGRRSSFRGESSLAFGYVSQANVAKLVSLGVPLLVGKAPGDSQFESLLSNSASKVLRGITWTTRSNAGRFEDDYQIFLDSAVVKRLEPAFQISNEQDSSVWQLVPDPFRAISVYRSSDLQSAWSSLNSALSMKLDAVSAVLVGSLLKSSLSNYGVENPRELLSNLMPPVMTIRPAFGEDSLLLGRMKEEGQLRKMLTVLVAQDKVQILNGLQDQPNREKEFTALFMSGFVVLGKTETILVYLDQLRNKETITSNRAESLDLTKHQDSVVVTYTNERESLSSILFALTRLNGQKLSEREIQAIEDRLASINVSSTESRLDENGIDRRTRSAFGQFGNILSLAVADSSTSGRK